MQQKKRANRGGEVGKSVVFFTYMLESCEAIIAVSLSL